jgi:hypothetical protein
MTTWSDVKIATLQKIFAITGDALVQNTSTTPYIKSMPQVANEAFQILSTAGKFITKDIEITQNPIQNILSSPLYMMNIYQHKNSDIPPYTAVGAKSYYFEVDNPAVVEVAVGETVVETITHTEKGAFTAYKGNISNPTSADVSIYFKGSYPYQYTNIALYDVTFESDADVWDYVSEKRYDMKTLVTDFYKLKDIVYQAGFNETRYEKTANYHREGDSVIVLGGLNKGRWKVFYHAYPQQITKDTPDNTVLSLDPEVAVLLPLYMASQLYKEDDNGLATQWRNEFEVARAELRPSESSGTVTFTSESGW